MSSDTTQRILYSATQAPVDPNAFTLDLIVRMLKTTVFHYSFGFVSIVAAKAFELPWEHPVTLFLLGYTSLLLIIYGILHLLRPKEEIVWEDQIVVITGGSGGLGSCLAGAFAIRGADVAVLDLVEAESPMPNVRYYKCDVSDVAQVKRVAERIRADIGEPTILINNAGCVTMGGILDVAPTDVETMFRTNILGYFWTIYEFLPAMLRRNQGHIVMIASIVGVSGSPGLTAYSSTKGAVVTLYDALHAELRMLKANVKATLVCPGLLNTRMFAGMKSANDFLLPIMSPMQVTEAVMEAVKFKQSREIYLPWAANLLGIFNILPVWSRTLIKHILGVSKATASLIKPRPVES
jgi:NAD(P)-dependent dehydrogenase (short-subunit alcohol dehydrogenase family)